MIELNDRLYLTSQEAANILVKTPEAVRQLGVRGKIDSVKIRGRLYFDHEGVLEYNVHKTHLPSFEKEAPKDVTYVALPIIAEKYNYNPAYLRKCIQEEALQGYITASGDVLISQPSLGKFLGEQHDISDI